LLEVAVAVLEMEELQELQDLAVEEPEALVPFLDLEQLEIMEQTTPEVAVEE